MSYSTVNALYAGLGQEKGEDLGESQFRDSLVPRPLSLTVLGCRPGNEATCAEANFHHCLHALGQVRGHAITQDQEKENELYRP